jgi:O-antigen/teichoic acid export membrane protein
MKNFAKALALFGAGSSIGTLTQIVKGKLGAVFLGVEGVGILNQLTNAWSLLYTFSGLGFYNGIVQRISQANSICDEESVKKQFVTSLIFLSLFSIIATIGAVLFSSKISTFIFSDNGEKSWMVIIALSSVPFAVISQIYSGLFSGHRLVRQVVATQVLTDIVGLIIFIYLVINSNIIGAICAFAA